MILLIAAIVSNFAIFECVVLVRTEHTTRISVDPEFWDFEDIRTNRRAFAFRVREELRQICEASESVVQSWDDGTDFTIRMLGEVFELEEPDAAAGTGGSSSSSASNTMEPPANMLHTAVYDSQFAEEMAQLMEPTPCYALDDSYQAWYDDTPVAEDTPPDDEPPAAEEKPTEADTAPSQAQPSLAEPSQAPPGHGGAGRGMAGHGETRDGLDLALAETLPRDQAGPGAVARGGPGSHPESLDDQHDATLDYHALDTFIPVPDSDLEGDIPQRSALRSRIRKRARTTP